MTVLPPTNPDKVDQAVTAQLARALDGQRGRSLAAFRAQLAAAPLDPYSFERAQAMRTLKLWAGAASALAACLALVLTLQFMANSGTNGRSMNVAQRGGGGNPNLMAVNAPAMDQVELSRDIDGGTAVLDDQTPVRVVREETLRQTRWFDPREKATYSMMQPVERVAYMRMQPY
jgi:hypothetical protein